MDDDDLNELYESLVLDHSKKPRNFGHLTCACQSQKGKNPSCGDHLELFLLVENNLVKDIKFEGDGCALSISSASLMTQLVKNKTIIETKYIIERFISFINEDGDLEESYEPLHIYKNVNKFPLRVKCVLLPWRTLEKITKDN